MTGVQTCALPIRSEEHTSELQSRYVISYAVFCLAHLDPDTLLAGGIQHVMPTEVIIYKPRWGAFFQTPLETHLRALGVSTLVFMGCNFPNCPRTSIYEASERDFRLIVVEDAISGLYERGKTELANIGAVLTGTDELVTALA